MPLFSEVLLGGRPGFVAVAYGIDPFHDRAGWYRHREWIERRYRWPARRLWVVVVARCPWCSGLYTHRVSGNHGGIRIGSTLAGSKRRRWSA